MYKREKKGFVPTRHLMSGHKQIFSTLSRDVVVYFVLFDSFIYYTRSIMYSLLLSLFLVNDMLSFSFLT